MPTHGRSSLTLSRWIQRIGFLLKWKSIKPEIVIVSTWPSCPFSASIKCHSNDKSSLDGASCSTTSGEGFIWSEEPVQVRRFERKDIQSTHLHLRCLLRREVQSIRVLRNVPRRWVKWFKPKKIHNATPEKEMEVPERHVHERTLGRVKPDGVIGKEILWNACWQFRLIGFWRSEQPSDGTLNYVSRLTESDSINQSNRTDQEVRLIYDYWSWLFFIRPNWNDLILN